MPGPGVGGRRGERHPGRSAAQLPAAVRADELAAPRARVRRRVQLRERARVGLLGEGAQDAADPPSTALRHAVWVAMAACADGAEHSGRALRVVQLILRTPALRARFLEHQAQWRDDLAVETARRRGLDPETDLYPRLAAGAALVAFDTVLRRWSDSDGAEDPAALTDRAFALLAPALDAG
ncbi:acyl-CoA-like ligand-binding transcription factor [Streptomyces rubiginosohelvolus]|uniref:acyl-CoA-like ligand-binding transcription factor n=1 Tax=Streptomyces rubiginosohelvolus TaxID=67362 RepID=UPI00380E017F